MRLNGMCPICFLRTVFTLPKKVKDIYSAKKYDNGAALVPPMGWSSWNTFKNNIDEDLIYQTGVAMKETGLINAGYKYINLDDCWHSSERTRDGELQGDLIRFAAGVPALVNKLNALGLKVGIYSSNGTLTCEDLPASLGNEYKDAYTFARWGIEFFKYDFCHNETIPSYAPLVTGVEIAVKGEKKNIFYPCLQARLTGLARFMPDDKCGKRVSGLDRCRGAMEYNDIFADESGEYVLTVCCRKKGRYEKALVALVNGEDYHLIKIPSQKHFNDTSRFQTVIYLKKGMNTLKLFNPITNRADSAMLQYTLMGEALKTAVARVAKENGKEVKPIVYSICEWGKNQPWKWGASAGNMWRTTPDIRPQWWWIKMIYERTVRLYKHAQPGGWNDPDMLEVGNGKLTEEQNKSHFALWCMMASPLILGNDLRNIRKEVLDIVTNRKLIEIDQDILGKPAKRIARGNVDVLARPLHDGSVAVCFFNKSKLNRNISFGVDKIFRDKYVNGTKKDEYDCTEIYSGKKYKVENKLEIKLKGDGCEVVILK